MRVVARVEGALTLRDIRRLFRETAGWSDDCPVEVSRDSITTARSITVTETDAQRQPSEANAPTTPQPKASKP